MRCDVTEWDQVEAMAAAALERFGRIDAVFANAGFGANRGFLEETPEHWRSMILTNVYGVALTIRATLPHMLERGDGDYLITSSVAGRRALPGSLYAATKHAVGGDRRGAAAGAAPDGRQRPHPGDPDRARDGRHRVLRLRGAGLGAARRGHRPRGALGAASSPQQVEVNEVLVRPTKQPM